jgi:hypothetical protein
MKVGLRNIGVGILMGLIGMPLLSCEDPVASKPLTELERAELRWARQSVHSYTYESLTSCFCASPVTLWCLVEVNRDTITRVTEIDSGDPVHASELDQFETIDECFARIRSLMNKEYLAELTVMYDSLYGYPTEIHFESKPTITDVGFAKYSQKLQPLP